MLEFQEKRKVKRFMYSRVTLVILLVIVAFLLKGIWGAYEKQRLTKENLNKVSIDFNKLKERESGLSSEIEWLGTKNGMEQEIREKYGLVKPGEEVIVIVNGGGGDSESIVSADSGFWQKMLEWLR